MSLELDQGEAKRIPVEECSGGDIESGGMGPCFGVFIYDPASKVTYGGHFAPGTVLHCPEDFTQMLDRAFAEFRMSNEIHVYASGCCQSNDRSEPGWQDTRRFVEAELQGRKTHATTIELRWPDSGVECVNMILEPESGYFELT